MFLWVLIDTGCGCLLGGVVVVGLDVEIVRNEAVVFREGGRE